jgi:uncharacterized membrane protein
MIIILVLVAIIFAGILWARMSYYSEGGAIIAFIAGILLLMVLIILPIEYHSTMSAIDKYNATELTIENARENGVDIENAALQQKIIDINQWLAGKKYWNETMFDIFIPDEVMDLEPLR